jgi:tRNA G37 N-methylase TrmD
MTFSQVVWLIGCCLVSASHKSIHKLRNKEKKESSVLQRKEIMNKLVADLLQQKG